MTEFLAGTFRTLATLMLFSLFLSCVSPLKNADGSILQMEIFVEATDSPEIDEKTRKKFRQLNRYTLNMLEERFGYGLYVDRKFTNVDAKQIDQMRHYLPEDGNYLTVVRLDDYGEKNQLLMATVFLYADAAKEPIFERAYRESDFAWRFMVQRMCSDMVFDIVTQIAGPGAAVDRRLRKVRPARWVEPK